jgi:hypothetical protein
MTTTPETTAPEPPARRRKKPARAHRREIIVAVRENASVAVSEDALFTQDGTVARVIARTDVGVNDLDGLCVIKAATGRSKA